MASWVGFRDCKHQPSDQVRHLRAPGTWLLVGFRLQIGQVRGSQLVKTASEVGMFFLRVVSDHMQLRSFASHDFEHLEANQVWHLRAQYTPVLVASRQQV